MSLGVADPRSSDATHSFTLPGLQAGAQPTRLIAAWGESEFISYHDTNLAKGEVVIFGGAENADAEPLSGVISNPEVSFFDVTAVSVLIGIQSFSFLRCAVPALAQRA